MVVCLVKRLPQVHDDDDDDSKHTQAASKPYGATAHWLISRDEQAIGGEVLQTPSRVLLTVLFHHSCVSCKYSNEGKAKLPANTATSIITRP